MKNLSLGTKVQLTLVTISFLSVYVNRMETLLPNSLIILALFTFYLVSVSFSVLAYRRVSKEMRELIFQIYLLGVFYMSTILWSLGQDILLSASNILSYIVLAMIPIAIWIYKRQARHSSSRSYDVLINAIFTIQATVMVIILNNYG